MHNRQNKDNKKKYCVQIYNIKKLLKLQNCTQYEYLQRQQRFFAVAQNDVSS